MVKNQKWTTAPRPQSDEDSEPKLVQTKKRKTRSQKYFAVQSGGAFPGNTTFQFPHSKSNIDEDMEMDAMGVHQPKAKEQGMTCHS